MTGIIASALEGLDRQNAERLKALKTQLMRTHGQYSLWRLRCLQQTGREPSVLKDFEVKFLRIAEEILVENPSYGAYGLAPILIQIEQLKAAIEARRNLAKQTRGWEDL